MSFDWNQIFVKALTAVADKPWIIPAAGVVFAVIAIAVARYRKPHPCQWRRARRLYRRFNGSDIDVDDLLWKLRTVDPYVFEELVLYSFSRIGYQIRRNKRYSGDGGVDGRMERNGRRFYLQMKRYSGHIQMAHVQDFSTLCRRYRRHGVFVHTGRTGAGSREAAADGNVDIVSGRKLWWLIVKGEDPLCWR